MKQKNWNNCLTLTEICPQSGVSGQRNYYGDCIVQSVDSGPSGYSGDCIFHSVVSCPSGYCGDCIFHSVVSCRSGCCGDCIFHSVVSCHSGSQTQQRSNRNRLPLRCSFLEFNISYLLAEYDRIYIINFDHLRKKKKKKKKKK